MVRQDMTRSNIRLGAKAKIAIMDVADIQSCGQSNAGMSLSVLHKPECNEPSHAGVCGYSNNDELVKLRLSKVARKCLVAARE